MGRIIFLFLIMCLLVACNKDNPSQSMESSTATNVLETNQIPIEEIDNNLTIYENIDQLTSDNTTKIESKIDGDFEGYDEDNIYKLMNGQIWKQTSFNYSYHYSFMPDLIIYQDSGEYKMIVEEMDEEIIVEQLSEQSQSELTKIESKIDGDFEGYDADNIYKLMNGQVWKQTSFNYSYHYSYTPDVVIFQDSGEYKMVVEDMDEAVTVELLE